jgi:hypothetical protein
MGYMIWGSPAILPSYTVCQTCETHVPITNIFTSFESSIVVGCPYLAQKPVSWPYVNFQADKLGSVLNFLQAHLDPDRGTIFQQSLDRAFEWSVCCNGWGPFYMSTHLMALYKRQELWTKNAANKYKIKSAFSVLYCFVYSTPNYFLPILNTVRLQLRARKIKYEN